MCKYILTGKSVKFQYKYLALYRAAFVQPQVK